MKTKNSVRLLIAAIAMVLYSCSTASNSSLLPGKWSCVSLVMNVSDETGVSAPMDYMKASRCDRPNTLLYIFDDKQKVTEIDSFSCKGASYDGSYKWLNEEKDLEVTNGKNVTLLHIVTLNKDSLVMTTGDAKNIVTVRMARK